MNTKNILVCAFAILMLCITIVGVNAYCYQESANTSNQGGNDGACGLLYTGAYYNNGSYWSGGFERVFDGNWSTGAGWTGGGNAYGWINYTIPPGATNDTLWVVKDSFGSTPLGGDLGSLSCQNVTGFTEGRCAFFLPPSCWNRGDGKLVFRADLVYYSYPFTTSTILKWNCQNSSGNWFKLRSTGWYTSSTLLFEEGVLWGGLSQNTTSSCVDSDSVIYPTIDRYTQGTMNATGITPRTDYCNGNYLLEYYCDDTSNYHPVPFQFDCASVGKVCSNGACVASTNGTCDDTDLLATPTINYDLLGVATTNNGTNTSNYQDYCYNSTHLSEYYCGDANSPIVASTIYGCGGICSGGACFRNQTLPSGCFNTPTTYSFPVLWYEPFNYNGDPITAHGWSGYPWVIGDVVLDFCS